MAASGFIHLWLICHRGRGGEREGGFYCKFLLLMRHRLRESFALRHWTMSVSMSPPGRWYKHVNPAVMSSPTTMRTPKTKWLNTCGFYDEILKLPSTKYILYMYISISYLLHGRIVVIIVILCLPSIAPAAAASFRISMLVFLLLGTASLLIPVVIQKYNNIYYIIKINGIGSS